MKQKLKKIIDYIVKINQEYPEKIIYFVGVFLFIWILVIVIFSKVVNEYTNIQLGQCIFLRLTGFFCPGCGGTRSVIYFFKGDLLKSISYNFFSTYIIILYLLFMGSHTLSILTKKKIKGLKFRPWFIYVAGLLLILQWILKNLLLIFLN